MDIKQIIIADYANVSREGKLNVMGIFGQIQCVGFPMTHPQMQLIISWQASRTEAGKNKHLEVQLADDDGKKLFVVGADFKLPEGKSGHKISGYHIMGFTGIQFPKQGNYQFAIMIGDEEKATVSLEVGLISKAK